VNHGNLLDDVPAALAGEDLRTLLTTPDLWIERIVSTGQASPPGFWYDQDWAEWVLLLTGQAALLVEGEAAPHVLTPGSYLHLPAHCRHRVEWTSTETPTVWLAVHHR
jgi:cupin 2 domain-containing protein